MIKSGTRTTCVRSSLGRYACVVGVIAWLALASACASRDGVNIPSGDAHAGPELDLSWIEGSWTTQAWTGTLNAEYVTRDDGFTVGFSRLIKPGSPTFPSASYYEFEVFGRDAEGYYLIPHPAGTPAPRFALASHDARTAIYENADKDFPTRIVYQRVAETLVLTLSDPVKNSAEPRVFVFTRTVAQPRTN